MTASPELATTGPPELESERLDYICSTCEFGAASGPPSRCPICGGSSWTAGRSPGGAHIAVTRLGERAFLLKPPDRIDGAASVVLSELIAALAHHRPEIVLDLATVQSVDERAARLILHLCSLTRGAGGRLLAISPTERESATALHELAPALEWGAGIHGALGRAPRQPGKEEQQ